MSMFFNNSNIINEIKIKSGKTTVDSEKDDNELVDDYTNDTPEEDDTTDNIPEEDDTTEDSESDKEDDTTIDDDYTDDKPEEDDNADDTTDDNTSEEDDTTNDSTDDVPEDDNTDYTLPDEDGGDDTSEEDDTTNDITDGDTGNDLQDLENKTLTGLSPQQIEIRNSELKNRFVDIYNIIADSLSKCSKLLRNDETSKTIDFIAEKLSSLKEMIYFYICNTYFTKTYTENSIMLQRYLVTMNTLNVLLDEIIDKKK